MDRRPGRAVLALSLVLALLAGACAEEEFFSDDPGAASSAGAGGAEVVANIKLTPADNPPFGLAEGTYRLEWASACAKITITITGDTGYTKKKSSPVPQFNTILTGVTAGTYQVAQLEADCTDWTIVVSKL